MYKISWLDSVGYPSAIHLTLDGKDTLCLGYSEYIARRLLRRSPKKQAGISNYCRICFRTMKKNIPWDPRCTD